jgi:triphosphoribosyl-dephospho-CoA synthase
VLLCAPVAAAAEAGGDLRLALAKTMADLDRRDAADVFAAIRLANPAGLGRVAQHDVAAPPETDLLTAMNAASDTDRIARAYVTGFADLFEIGLQALAGARADGLAEPWTTTAIYLAFLAATPDTHIARKHGLAQAEAVRVDAAERLRDLSLTAMPVEALLAFDTELKARGINPGTSADMTVATVFIRRLLDQ